MPIQYDKYPTMDELSYLQGAIGNIQQQIDGLSGGGGGGVTTGDLTEATSSVLNIVGGTDAVVGSGTSIQVKQASTSQSGYLSNTDWNTFNSKEPALTKGNLTELTSSVLTISGGTNAVIGSGTSIQVKQASGLQGGFLASTDFNTFNGKQDSLVSGTNIKTINSGSILGLGDLLLQDKLISGTNIKTINTNSILGSGDLPVQDVLVSGTNIKTINSTSILGSGNIAVQPTLVSGTNIKTIDGATILGSGNILSGSHYNVLSALGSTIKGTSFPFDNGSWASINTGGAFLSGRLQFQPLYLPQATTLTGVKIICPTTGNYTGNNYNGVGLYTYSGGTLTLVASTTNDANFWKPVANTLTAKPFSATYSATAGLYYLGLLYSSSAQTTAPALPIVNIFSSPYGQMDFTNSAKIFGSVNSQTSLPSSQAMSGVAVFTTAYCIHVY